MNWIICISGIYFSLNFITSLISVFSAFFQIFTFWTSSTYLLYFQLQPKLNIQWIIWGCFRMYLGTTNRNGTHNETWDSILETLWWLISSCLLSETLKTIVVLESRWVTVNFFSCSYITLIFVIFNKNTVTQHISQYTYRIKTYTKVLTHKLWALGTINRYHNKGMNMAQIKLPLVQWVEGVIWLIL